jgi:hypothetical protein
VTATVYDMICASNDCFSICVKVNSACLTCVHVQCTEIRDTVSTCNLPTAAGSRSGKCKYMRGFTVAVTVTVTCVCFRATMVCASN